MRGQAFVEFMVVISLMLLLFGLVLGLYIMQIEEADSVAGTLGANEVCLSVSSTLSSFAALGGNSTYQMDLNDNIAGSDYEVWVNSGLRVVKVNFGSAGISCPLQTNQITNSSGATLFKLEKNASITNHGEVLVVG